MLRLCLAVTLLCLASALPTIENANHPGRVAGEYLVLLKPAPAVKARYVQEVVAKIQSVGVTILRQMDAFKSPILHVKADDLTISQAFHIPEVVNIEANVFEKRIEQCTVQTVPDYWGLDRTDQRNLPLNGIFGATSSGGSGVSVYVLDTGIRTTHVEFGGRARFGVNFSSSPNTDGNGHGTHCAGTVGGANAGVAKGVSLVSVKVLSDSGSGFTSSIINGINWVINEVGSSGNGIISMSLGGGASSSFDAAVNDANSRGIPVVVAAGNSNANACNFSPARATGAITIASSTNTDARSSFSNIGTCCDLFAPGSSIRSAWYTSDTAYNTISGTSMACPHVAGAAAVYRGRTPNATPAQVRSYLTDGATSGVISNPGTGTPNLLLYEAC